MMMKEWFYQNSKFSLDFYSEQLSVFFIFKWIYSNQAKDSMQLMSLHEYTFYLTKCKHKPCLKLQSLYWTTRWEHCATNLKGRDTHVERGGEFI